MQNAFLKLVKLKHIFTAIASSTANSLISIISLVLLLHLQNMLVEVYCRKSSSYLSQLQGNEKSDGARV